MEDKGEEAEDKGNHAEDKPEGAEDKGKEAASELLKIVRARIAATKRHESQPEIVVHIYGFKKGLKRVYHNLCIDPRSVGNFSNFLRGFNEFDGNVTYISLDTPKATMTKLRSDFYLHWRKPHCQNIILGVPTDEDFTDLLTTTVIPQNTDGHVIFIDSPSFEKVLDNTTGNQPTIDLGSLIRAKPLPKEPIPEYEAQAPAEPDFDEKLYVAWANLDKQLSLRPDTVGTEVGAASSAPSDRPFEQGTTDKTSSLVNTQACPNQPSSTTVSQPTNTNVSTSSAGAGTSRSDPSPAEIQISVPNGRLTASGERIVYQNGQGLRIDARIPHNSVDTGLLNQIQARNICNVRYLLGECQYGATCFYDHSYELTDKLYFTALRLARTQPGDSAKCDDPRCMKGHTCPRGPTCDMSRCRYPRDRDELFGMGRVWECSFPDGELTELSTDVPPYAVNSRT